LRDFKGREPLLLLTKLALPASAHFIHCLLKNILDLLVRCFCLTAHLRVIWSGNPVFTPTSVRAFRNVRSMKCDPPSLITIRGTPYLGKMTS
jgi:hypothetical protein